MVLLFLRAERLSLSLHKYKTFIKVKSVFWVALFPLPNNVKQDKTLPLLISILFLLKKAEFFLLMFTIFEGSEVARSCPTLCDLEVKCALGSFTMSKANGGNEIPAELFEILKEDAVKVLHSIC